MRKQQAQLNFEDSSYRVSRAIEQLSAETTDFVVAPPPTISRRHKMKLVCLECSTNFSSSSAIPSCPGCGGSDVELA